MYYISTLSKYSNNIYLDNLPRCWETRKKWKHQQVDDQEMILAFFKQSGS